jgi:ankyrin repeat protein
VEKNDITTIENLIRIDANVNIKNAVGKTPLEISISKGNEKVIMALLESKQLSLNEKNNEDETYLTSVIKSNYKERLKFVVLEKLLLCGADPNIVDGNDQSPLLIALEKQCPPSIIKVLTDHEARVTFILELNETSLIVKYIKYLMKCNANIILDPKEGVEIINKVVDIVLTTKNTTIFKYFVKNNIDCFSIDAVKKIIDRDNKLNLLQILVENDLNINMKDEKGNTLLDYAVQYQSQDIKIYLLDHGAIYHGEEEEECPICYNILGPSRENRRCKICRNTFHKKCLITWFENSPLPTCPLCRNIILEVI